LDWPKLSIFTAGIHGETPLNMILELKTENSSKIDTVQGGMFVGGEKVNE
jgi:hypothetical protein